MCCQSNINMSLYQLYYNDLLKYVFVLGLIWCLVFYTTFSNISAISWRPVLVVEDAGVPGETNLPWASRVQPFWDLQSRVRTHAVLVIGWYELLRNPTCLRYSDGKTSINNSWILKTPITKIEYCFSTLQIRIGNYAVYTSVGSLNNL